MSDVLAHYPDSIRSDTNSKTMHRIMMTKTRDSDFVMLLTAIQTACKLVSRSVGKAGIAGLYGHAGTENATGGVKNFQCLKLNFL
jgi:fructose-1,6-bisphosphatase